MDALRRSSRISRKDRNRNVTIRQQIGLEETIIKEIEQNHLTWYGHVQGMAEGRLPKIALKWMPKQKRARGRPKKNWMEGIRKVVNERNLNEGQWEDRKQYIYMFVLQAQACKTNTTKYQPQQNSNTQRTENKMTDVVIH